MVLSALDQQTSLTEPFAGQRAPGVDRPLRDISPPIALR
jgi:hypothetical protein